jgi:replicative DNA helicase
MNISTENHLKVVSNPKNNSNQNYYFGSPTQHNFIIETEEKILCSLIVDGEKSYIPITNILNEDCFFSSSNKKIFKACVAIKESGERLNYQNIREYLINDSSFSSVGGNEKIKSLLSHIPNITNIESIANILLKKHARRLLEQEGNDIVKQSRMDFNKDVDDIIFEAEGRLLEIKELVKKAKEQEKSCLWKDIALEFTIEAGDEIDNIASGNKILGYHSGLYDLDDAVGSFQPGDFIIFGGPSGIGKTAFGCSLLYKFGKQEIPTLFLSGEMPEKQIAGRIFATDNSINSRLLTRERHKLTYQNLETLYKSSSDTEDYTIAIKGCNPGISEIKNNIINAEKQATESRMKNFDGKFKIIFLDYLQLLAESNSKSDNRSSEIDKLAQWCKQYARDNNCVMIALAQVSDECLTRSTDKVPGLSDIGWCKTAKNHADYLAMLWTDYFNSVNTPNKLDDLPDQEILQIYFRKSRHTGFLGMVPLLLTRSICQVKSVVKPKNY